MHVNVNLEKGLRPKHNSSLCVLERGAVGAGGGGGGGGGGGWNFSF